MALSIITLGLRIVEIVAGFLASGILIKDRSYTFPLSDKTYFYYDYPSLYVQVITLSFVVATTYVTLCCLLSTAAKKVLEGTIIDIIYSGIAGALMVFVMITLFSKNHDGPNNGNVKSAEIMSAGFSMVCGVAYIISAVLAFRSK